MPVELRRERSVSDVLNATSQFIREHLSVLIRALIYFASPPMILAQILNVVTANPMAGGGELAVAAARDPVPLILLRLVGVFLQLIGGFIAAAVVVGGVRAYDRNPDEPLTIAQLRDAAKNYWRDVFVVNLMMVSLAAIIIASVLALGAGIRMLVQQVSALLTGILTAVASLGFVGGIMYFGNSVVVAVPARILEPIGSVAAIQRSIRLVRGKFWQTFGVLFLAGIIGGTLILVTSIPFMVVDAAMLVSGFGQAGIVGQALAIAAGAIAGIGYAFYAAIAALASTIQYFNLVERKDQTGLKRRVAEMAEEDESSAPASTEADGRAKDADTAATASVTSESASSRWTQKSTEAESTEAESVEAESSEAPSTGEVESEEDGARDPSSGNGEATDTGEREETPVGQESESGNASGDGDRPSRP